MKREIAEAAVQFRLDLGGCAYVVAGHRVVVGACGRWVRDARKLYRPQFT
jgi:hypothetical protein